MTQAQRAAADARGDLARHSAPGNADDAGAAADKAPPLQSGPPAAFRGLLRAGWRLGAGASVLGVESAAGCLYPVLGAALATIDVLAPLGIALVLLAAILRGNDQTCERVFRLLRWLTGCPEPPAPGTTSPEG